jgi:hypothetical protein
MCKTKGDSYGSPFLLAGIWYEGYNNSICFENDKQDYSEGKHCMITI